MTTHSTLGPFMTLILTLTAKGNSADDVISPSHAAVVNSLMFARLVIETPESEASRIRKPHWSRVPDRQLTASGFAS
jgi:hypothetical protein